MSITLIQIEPSLPMCWENPDTLRFGFDLARVRLHRPSPAAQRFIAVLRKGVISNDLRGASRREGLNSAEHRNLLTALAPILRSEAIHTAAAATPPRTVVVHGTGELAFIVERALERGGFVICHARATPTFAVVIEHFLEPASSAHHLLINEIPHLALRMSDSSATIGPLVGPEGAPCLSCVELHGLQHDPLAPHLAAQLCLDVPRIGSQSCLEALAAVATAIIDGWYSDRTAFTGCRLRFDITAGNLSPFPSVEAIAPHHECGCVALAKDSPDEAIAA